MYCSQRSWNDSKLLINCMKNVFKKDDCGPASPKRSEGGQTLIEVLLALSASVLILSAIVVIVITSLSGTQFTKNQNLANQYAQEGIEIIRRIRDSGGWTGFSAIDGRYCLSGGTTSLPPSSPSCTTPNIGTDFIRQIDIGAAHSDCPPGGAGPNGSKVASIVSWSDGKCPASNEYCHKVELISCFYNVNQ